MSPRKKKNEEAPPAVEPEATEPEATEPEAPEAPVEDASPADPDTTGAPPELADLSEALQKIAEVLSAHKTAGKVSANIDRAIVKVIDAKTDIDNELSMF